MTQEGQLPPPPVMWAQRSNILFVTICLEDCKDPTIKVEADKVYFKGTGGTDRKNHEVTINLYDEINPDKTVQSPKGRNIELVLMKKNDGPFWPRLTKENQKFHWLKSDFNKWVDEDDSDDDLKDKNMADFTEFFGTNNSDNKMNFDDLDMGEESPNSDDDVDLPYLE